MNTESQRTTEALVRKACPLDSFAVTQLFQKFWQLTYIIVLLPLFLISSFFLLKILFPRLLNPLVYYVLFLSSAAFYCIS
jgi:hypothetical protein